MIKSLKIFVVLTALVHVFDMTIGAVIDDTNNQLLARLATLFHTMDSYGIGAGSVTSDKYKLTYNLEKV